MIISYRHWHGNLNVESCTSRSVMGSPDPLEACTQSFAALGNKLLLYTFSI